MTDLEELKKIAEAATPGPWIASGVTSKIGDLRFMFVNSDDLGEIARVCLPDRPPKGYAPTICDQRFIAAARSALPALIARVEAAEAEVDRLKNELGDPQGVVDHAEAITARAEAAEAENARLREAVASARREGVDEALEIAKDQAKLMANITADLAIYGTPGNSRQREAMEAALTRYAQKLEYTLAALGRQS